MQALQKPAIKKRARYYHSQLDMELLLSGLPYADLPNTYVIFICDFDPFGKQKYRYTQKKVCGEAQELNLDDGAHTIFLSTKGKNADEVPQELVKLLDYVGASLLDSEQEFEDDFVRKLQSAVRDVKASREMGARYMTFQDLLNDERAQERIQIAERMIKGGVAIEDVINYTQLTEEQLRELMSESK